MTAKTYLQQARYLDNLINCKIEQVSSLNDLATKCTSAMTGMPHNPGGSVSRMADTIVKIVDLQEEINRDIDRLVDTKADIISVIDRIGNEDYRIILSKRYLNFSTWEEIAADIGFDTSWVYRMHGRALEKVQQILDERENA